MGICERCPITTKVRVCCGSNPETHATKLLWNKKRRIALAACANLSPDGYCTIWYFRPESCAGFGCHQWLLSRADGKED